MSYDYSRQEVWIAELAPEPHPSVYDLCGPCAERTSPPRGWLLTDQRERRLFEAAS